MKCSIIKNLVVVFLICTQAGVAAANEFFHQRYRGWLWFEEREQQRMNEERQQELEKVQKQEQERDQIDLCIKKEIKLIFQRSNFLFFSYSIKP